MNSIESAPLADVLRPKSLDKYFFQKESSLGKLFNLWGRGVLSSFVLYGPPGSGKTSALTILSEKFEGPIYKVNAVDTGIKELRELVGRAQNLRRSLTGEASAILIDEVHRLSRSQQDVLLPALEDGSLLLFAATTENPYVVLNSAFLSRVQAIKVKPLSEVSMKELIFTVLDHFNLEKKVISKKLEDALLETSSGDARSLISNLERVIALFVKDNRIEEAEAESFLKGLGRNKSQKGVRADFMSALIKSMRASHHKAAIFYLGCLLKAKEDPEVIYRRLMIFTSEDIGEKDARAAILIASLWQGYERTGMPEGRYGLFQAVTYLSKALKGRSHSQQIEWCSNNVPYDFDSLTLPRHLVVPGVKKSDSDGFFPKEYSEKIK